MNKRSFIQIVTFLLLFVAEVRAGDFNPQNPPDPHLYFKVTTATSPTNAGYTSGGGNYLEGATVTLSTSARSGFAFSHWTMNGDSLTNRDYFTMTMPNRDLSFVAVYKPVDVPEQPFNPANPQDPSMPTNYKLYLESNMSGCCSFNITSGVRYQGGQSIRVAVQYITPGYVFLGWFQDDEQLSTALAFYFDMPYDDARLTARFVYRPSDPADPSSVSSQDNIDNRMRGDLNSDNKVDMGDAVAIVYHLQNSSTHEVPDSVGDVNHDGDITVDDALSIINKELLPVSSLNVEELEKVDNPFYEEANSLVDKACDAVAKAVQDSIAFLAFVRAMNYLLDSPTDSTAIVAALQVANASVTEARQAIAAAKLALAVAANMVAQEAKAAQERKQGAATVVAAASQLADEPLEKVDNPFYEEANALVDKANAAILAAQQAAAEYSSLVDSTAAALSILASGSELDAALKTVQEKTETAQQAITAAKLALAAAAEKTADEAQAAKFAHSLAEEKLAETDKLELPELPEGANVTDLYEAAQQAIAEAKEAAEKLGLLVDKLEKEWKVRTSAQAILDEATHVDELIVKAQQAIDELDKAIDEYSGVKAVVSETTPCIRVVAPQRIVIDNLSERTHIIVCNLAGKVVVDQYGYATVTIGLSKGQYIVRAGRHVMKLVL